MFWAATGRGCRAQRSTAAASARYGGQMTTSTSSASATARQEASRKASVSSTVLCIFQLAAIRDGGRSCRSPPRRRAAPRLPGSSLPSISSSEAPPPVESQSTSSARPNSDQRRAGVAAADDGAARRRGDGLGDRAGPGGEGLQLERAHRPVPEDGPGAGDRLGVGGRGLRADVEAHPAVGHLDPVELARLGVGGELSAEDEVGRQAQLAARAPRPRSSTLARQLDALLLDQRVAGLDAPGRGRS